MAIFVIFSHHCYCLSFNQSLQVDHNITCCILKEILSFHAQVHQIHSVQIQKVDTVRLTESMTPSLYTIWSTI